MRTVSFRGVISCAVAVHMFRQEVEKNAPEFWDAILLGSYMIEKKKHPFRRSEKPTCVDVTGYVSTQPC